MDFVDSAGTRYQLTETVEAPAPAKKAPVWPWVVGGLAVAGGLVWMASSSNARTSNPTNDDIEALIAEARDPNTTNERMLRLVWHSNVEVRRALLENPNLCRADSEGNPSPDVLAELTVRMSDEVAQHPMFVLHALVEPTESWMGLLAMVAGKTTDVALIEHVLSTQGRSFPNVRAGVACNPRTPVEVLRFLGNEKTEPHGPVRQAVAWNPSTPVDVLRVLGNIETESQWPVRETVAQNKNGHTPKDLLQIMSVETTEPIDQVRETALESLQMLAYSSRMRD